MTTINKLIISGIFLSIMLVLAIAIPNIAQAQYYLGNGCMTHSSERCNGNYLYWYDSCGDQQDIAQYCTNGCYNNLCQNSYNNNNYNNYNNYNNSYSNCTYHAYKLCSGNNIYWYDSCGTQQDLYSSCVGGQVCQYSQCTSYIINPVLPPIQQPITNYTAYSKTACYNNSIYWYDSLGTISGLSKNCNDKNSCTIDTCSADKCSNILKCDGSTCIAGSNDYNNSCLPAVEGASTSSTTLNKKNTCGNGFCELNLGETDANCPSDCKLNPATTTPVVSTPVTTAPVIVTTPAAVASTPASTSSSSSSGFWGFLKRWYLWILSALILIFLFVVVFKRFSSEV